MVRKLMNMMFLSCLRATELMEKKLHFHLSFTEKYRLKMHKMMCDACRRYEKQNLFIEKRLDHHHTKQLIKMDLEELKKSIKHSIK